MNNAADAVFCVPDFVRAESEGRNDTSIELGISDISSAVLVKYEIHRIF